MADRANVSALLARLAREGAIRQLVERSGYMASLGTESGQVKLDWVEAPRRLLDDPDGPERVEREARALVGRGIRYVIWSGMGGSVTAVRNVRDLVERPSSPVLILPLDSTDPVAVQGVVETIERWEGVVPAEGGDPTPDGLRRMLAPTVMIAVSMGMTSEEPITHLRWFLDLLSEARMPAAEHALVMTLPDSYLERFARDRGLPTLPLQPDCGNGTGGRMSAPGTRVFLLPAALYLGGARPGALRTVIETGWRQHDLDGALRNPADHPYVRLAAGLAASAETGVCRSILALPRAWAPLFPWVEQLSEESLGKGGRGLVLFEPQDLNTDAPSYHAGGLALLGGTRVSLPSLRLPMPERCGSTTDTLVALTRAFLGWQLAVAIYGYLNDIVFAGQPAVEEYKRRARDLRESGQPLAPLASWSPQTWVGGVTVLPPPRTSLSTEERVTFRSLLASAAARSPLLYVDVTYNGELSARAQDALRRGLRRDVNQALGLPWKLRRAPAAYHATEQSEMDGPPGLVSFRILPLGKRPPTAGTYSDHFLTAQGIATWQAMMGKGHQCYLLTVDARAEGWEEAVLGFFAADGAA
jgi:hypothetical protein